MSDAAHSLRLAVGATAAEANRIAQEAKAERERLIGAGSLTPQGRSALDRSYLHALQVRDAKLAELAALDEAGAKASLLDRLYGQRPRKSPHVHAGTSQGSDPSPGTTDDPRPAETKQEVSHHPAN